MGYEGYNMEPGGNRNGQQNQKPFVNPINSADFPSLGNATEVPQTRATSSVTFTKISSKPFRAEDFPSLGNTLINNFDIFTSTLQRYNLRLSFLPIPAFL